MKTLFSLLVLFLCGDSYAQFSADGFFVQENMYIDPYLLKVNKVDSFVIRFNDKNRICFYLDSTGKVNRKIFYNDAEVKEYFFHVDGLNNYACYYLPKDKAVCENNRIISFDGFKKKNSKNKFDAYGRFLQSITQKNGIRYTKTVQYNADGSIDKITSTIGAMALIHQYEYKQNKLLKIKQSSYVHNEESSIENTASFIYYESGLVKSREGYFLNNKVTLKCDFTYYSRGVELK